MNIQHKEEKFSLIKDNKEIGFLKYGILDDLMYINGVVVEPEHRGQGYAKKLTLEGVAYAKEKKLKIIPRCPYVADMFDRGGFEDIDARD